MSNPLLSQTSLWLCILPTLTFGIPEIPGALRLLKLHGSIDSDVADGGKSRLIITENDYELAEEFRQYLFTTLESDLIGTDLIIVGHSLSDPDIRTLITRVTTIRRKSGSGGSIYLFAYSPNLERAELHEARGLIVCFGGIDDFAHGSRDACSRRANYTVRI